MKKIILAAFFLFFFFMPAWADDSGLGDYSNSIDNAWYGQKQITDEDFEKTLKKIEDKKKNKKKKKLKGNTIEKQEKSEIFNEIVDSYILLNLPVDLVSNTGEDILMGHYRVIAKTENGVDYLEFYQAYDLVAKLPVVKSDSDFGQKEVNFVKVVPYSQTQVKLIFGSVDFNAYTLIDLKNKIE